MKNPDRDKVSRLAELPNIGRALAATLEVIGIDHPRKLIGKDPYELYERLCAKSRKKYDPCVLDVFISVVHYMEGGDALPWWSFTEGRKRRLASGKPPGTKTKK